MQESLRVGQEVFVRFPSMKPPMYSEEIQGRVSEVIDGLYNVRNLSGVPLAYGQEHIDPNSDKKSGVYCLQDWDR